MLAADLVPDLQLTSSIQNCPHSLLGKTMQSASKDHDGELVNGHIAIPLEPSEMVLRERAYYEALGNNLGRDNGSSQRYFLSAQSTNRIQNHLPRLRRKRHVGTSWNTAYGAQIINSPAYDPDVTARRSPIMNCCVFRAYGSELQPTLPLSMFNVTTQDPGVQALVNTGYGDTAWGIGS